MTKIEISAEDFSRDICASECGAPRDFFKHIKMKMKKSRRKFRFDAEMSAFHRTAEKSLKALENEGIFPLVDGVPYMFLLSAAYISSEDGALGSSLRAFLGVVSKHHDFLISEALLLRDFLTVALFDAFFDAPDDKKPAIADKFDLIDYISFGDLYIEFAKVHEIFAREKADVYDNCTADTKSYYDEILTIKYGSDEIGNAKMLVARADNEGEHVGKYLLHTPNAGGGAYFWLLTVLTAGAFFIVLMLSDIVTALVALMPCYALSKEITLMFFERNNLFLPALQNGDEIKKTKCIVSIATLLGGEGTDCGIFDNIEDFYLSNREDNFVFAVLGDLKEADRKHVSSDAAVIKYARSRIDALNAKYGERFALFIRRRRYAVCEKKYFGWERKRGAVLELCRYAAGDDGSFETIVGGSNVRGAKYLLTLDSDTRLGVSSVKKLLGIMLHPQNRAKIGLKRRAVVSGYGILQPKMATSLASSSQTLFASLTSGDGGVDRYSSSSFDLYQDVFGTGIFCGKGMIDIGAFLAVCDGVFPKERILSHDLLEGALARAATVKSVVLTDCTPKNAVSYYSRLDRWYRGDIQALIYAGGKIRNEAGETARISMSGLSHFQLIDNVIRAATPLFSIILFSLCVYFEHYAALFPLIFIVIPTLKAITTAIARPRFQNAYSLKKTFERTFADFALCVGSAATRAGVFLGALSSVVGSALFTKRGFLSWTTAAQTETKSKGSLIHHVLSMWFSVATGVVFLVLPLPAKMLGAIWILFPIVMWALGKEKRRDTRLSPKNDALLRSYAADMWRFFEENVGESTNWLPPDNVQFSPVYAFAMRTSPTNVGLYFLSMLASRDLGFIDTAELVRRASAALDSLGRMKKWNGHLFNWYDLKTLDVIGAPFVSSVDSGNFVTALVAFKEGIKEYVPENPALIGIIDGIVNHIYGADFGKLVNKERGFLSVGFNASTGELSDSCYDTLMSESRTTSYYLEATGCVPSGYYYSLGRKLTRCGARIGATSWSGTAFEFFMPSLLLPDMKNSLAGKTLELAFLTEQRRACAVPGKNFSVYGVSESCFFEFDKDMNYQYRAFGLSELSLDPKTRDERVISPYSSFLLLCESVPRVLSNLEKLRQVGMYGRYGFYEALDLEPRRVGGGYAVIKSCMSHHVGMSIVAVANACMNDVFVKRFMRDADMRACRDLLGEKMPASVVTAFKKEMKKSHEKATAPRAIVYEPIRKRHSTLLCPDVFMLSNNKTRVVAASGGHVAIYDGADAVVLSGFERLSLGGGLQFYALFDGKIISAAPLGFVSDGICSSYDFSYDDEKIVYSSSHASGSKKANFDVTIRLYENDETVEITYRLSGDVSDAKTLLYFEPIIDDARSFDSHKSFSNLFIESKFYPDERVLVYSRRPRSDGKPFKYLGICAFPPISQQVFDTRRDEILPLMYSARDIASLISSDGEGKTGAVIVPACALRSACVGGRVRRATFKIAYSRSCDDLLYAVSSPRGGNHTGKIAELQRASSGADDTVRAFEQELIGKIVFPRTTRKWKNEALLRALAKKPVKADGLWRHGISGNMNIVSAAVGGMKNGAAARLLTVLRLFKYSCVRGMRFDLVIIFSESDAYNESVKKAIDKLISDAGLSAFIGCDGGIFAFEKDDLTDGECFALTECATQCFDLTSEHGFDFDGENGIELSEKVTSRLKKEPSVEVSDIPLPRRFEKCEKTLGGYAASDGFVIEKGVRHKPWAHVISSRSFGTVLTENSLGFTFFSNAALGKLTPHTADNMNEDKGERVIIRVFGDSGDYSDFDAAACAKYVFYSENTAEYIGKAGEIGYVMKVSLGGRFPVKRVEVTLSSNVKTRVKIIYLLRRGADLSAKNRMTAAFFDVDDKCVSFKPIYVAGGRAVRVLLALKDGNFGFFDDEASFITDKDVFGGEEIAAIYDEATFSSKHESVFFLCHAESDEARRFILTKIANSFDEPERTFVTPTVSTGDRRLDASVNFWLPYQTISSRIRARSGFYQVGGAYGYRDQLQDVISLIPFSPRLAREQIIRASARQYEDGSVMHWWHVFGGFNAGIRSRISDDSAWLALTLSEYVEKTGDASVLDVKTPYLSSPPLSKEENERYESAVFSHRKDTVLCHAVRGLIRTFRTGEHGLPLIGTGDWNDGMNSVGRHGKGESVWLAFFSAICAERLAPFCKARGMDDVACELLLASRRLIDAARGAFDGGWFIRGYYDSGEKLGARNSDECVIDVMPQAFAAIAASEVDSSLAEKAKIALESALDMLFDRENLIFRLLWPPFDCGSQSPGYIKGYVPGIRENGGQYTHAAVFAALGMFRVGMNKEATELLFAINQLLRESPRYKIEPYVLAGDVYSNPACAGRGGWSWYTGAAGWYRTVFIEELCGFRQRGDEFSIRPRLNSLFASFEMDVRRGATHYVIRASMSESDFAVLDGKASENRFFFDGREHTVEIFSNGRGEKP